MINLIFKENRSTGYSEVNYSSSDEKEVVKQVSESELNDLIPDGFDAESWKEVRRYYKLDDSGNIVFDEAYEPETEDEE